MLQVQCPGCLTQVFLECTCPPDYLAAAAAHQPGCTHADIDAMVRCPDPAATGCCAIAHDHAAAAGSCPGIAAGHPGAPCPEPGTCRVWRGAVADALHPASDGTHPLFTQATGAVKDGVLPPCPGGHCHKDTEGCTVCRPLIITVMPGTELVPVPGALPVPSPPAPSAAGG